MGILVDLKNELEEIMAVLFYFHANVKVDTLSFSARREGLKSIEVTFEDLTEHQVHCHFRTHYP
jgi:hypothetical protein